MAFLDRLSRRLGAASPVWIALLLFALGLLVRLAVVLARHPDGHARKYELERVAMSLATLGVYGNPYAIATGPTAHVAPGYTLILAGLFRLFGTGAGGALAQMILASVVTAFICALLPAVAGVLRLPRVAGMIAGTMLALSPVQIDGAWESPYVLLALMLVAALTAHLWMEHDTTAKLAVLHGLCWGIVLLFAPAMLSTFVVLALVGTYFFRQAGINRYFSFIGVEILMIGLCLAPWVIRNYRAFGSPILTRSNFGLEMRISNNDLAGADQITASNRGAFRQLHPLMSITEAAKVRDTGELAYNKEELRLAREWILTHPKKFIRLSLTRARYFWFGRYPTSSGVSFGSRMLAAAACSLRYLTTLLALAGLIYALRGRPVTGSILLVLLLTYSLPYYFVHFTPRYAYPVEWILALLSAVVVVEARQRWSQRISVSGGLRAPRALPLSA